MAVHTFVGVEQVKLGTLNGLAVYAGHQRVWPAHEPHFELNQSANNWNNSTAEVTVFSGDIIHTTHKASTVPGYIDTAYGLFHVKDASTWEPLVAFPNPSTWVKAASAYNGATVQAWVAGARSNPSIDTTGWPVGDYVIAAGDFNTFDHNTGQQLLIHVVDIGIPPTINLQLPDDPFDPAWTLQVIDVVPGQDIHLIYPVNPLPINDDSSHPTWRHLNFVGWDGTTTTVKDFLSGNVIYSSEPAGTGYGYTFVNNGIRSTNKAPTGGVDMYDRRDIFLHITDALKPGVYIVPSNGNYKTDDYDLQGDALFYLRLPVPPPHAPTYLNFKPAQNQAVKQRMLDWLNEYDADFSGAAVQHFDAKGGDILSIPGFPTVGSAYEVQAIAVVTSSGALVGTPDPGDVPNADGTFQTRYGGNWTLPTAPGIYTLMAGPDAGGLQVALATVTVT